MKSVMEDLNLTLITVLEIRNEMLDNSDIQKDFEVVINLLTTEINAGKPCEVEYNKDDILILQRSKQCLGLLQYMNSIGDKNPEIIESLKNIETLVEEKIAMKEGIKR